jgi:hypothetical protein
MDDPGRRQGSVTGGQEFGLGADLNHAAALQDNSLSWRFMRVRSVLLASSKEFKPAKRKITLRYRALPNPHCASRSSSPL